MMRIGFITGVARSGTSILGEYVAAHPEVNYRFETHDWFRWVNRYGVTKHGCTPKMRKEVRNLIAKKANNRYFVEKTGVPQRAFPFFFEAVPEAKYIHIVRDGRDVACSLRTARGKNIEKVERRLKKQWSSALDQKLKRIKAITEPAFHFANEWQTIMSLALDAFARLPKELYLRVYYEDLIDNPTLVGEKICDFLGLSFHQKMAAFTSNISNNVNHSYHAEHQVHLFDYDHEKRVERYKENLTQDEIQRVTSLLEPTLERLGYLVSSGKTQ